MKVYVVMSNDYPDRVFANENTAEDYCKRKMEEQKKELKPWETPRIYYHTYAFDVQH